MSSKSMNVVDFINSTSGNNKVQLNKQANALHYQKVQCYLQVPLLSIRTLLARLTCTVGFNNLMTD